DVVRRALRPAHAQNVAAHVGERHSGVDGRAAGLEPEVESGRVDELGIRILDVGADPAAAHRARAQIVVDVRTARRARNADVLAGGEPPDVVNHVAVDEQVVAVGVNGRKSDVAGFAVPAHVVNMVPGDLDVVRTGARVHAVVVRALDLEALDPHEVRVQ